MTHATRIIALKTAVAALMIGPGLIMVAGLGTPLLWVTELFLDLAILPLDGANRIDTTTARLLDAILGGVLVGFGLLIWQVAGRVYATDPALGRSLIVPAIAAWFVVDSTGSVLAGAPFNAVLNLGILALLLGPLLWPAPKELPQT